MKKTRVEEAAEDRWYAWCLAEWQGMPEFVMRDLTPKKTLIVSFANLRDMDQFAELMGQTVNETTRSIWWPEQPEVKMRGRTQYIERSEWDGDEATL